MPSLFPAMGKEKQEDFDWAAFEKEVDTTAKACDKCKDIDWQDDDDIVVCKACGAVTDRPLDMGAEYRFFSSDDRGGGEHVDGVAGWEGLAACGAVGFARFDHGLFEQTHEGG